MHRFTLLASAAVIVTSSSLLVSCFSGPDSPLGFSLPEGDPVAGEQVMHKYQCLACHTMQGFDDVEQDQSVKTKLPLGGKVSTIVTYADLVTSIINPSHKLSRKVRQEHITENRESKMANYDDLMTVTELINLVSFLQPKYELHPYTPTNYNYYYFENEANKS